MIKEEFEILLSEIYKIFNIDSNDMPNEDTISIWSDSELVDKLPENEDFQKFVLNWFAKEYRFIPINMIYALNQCYQSYIAGNTTRYFDSSSDNQEVCKECLDGYIVYLVTKNGKKYEYISPCKHCNTNNNPMIKTKNIQDINGEKNVLKYGFKT